MLASDENMAAGLCRLWSALHHDVELTIRESDAQCLKMIALQTDDELISHLLLAKLRRARLVDDRSPPASLVVMNSFVAFDFDGRRRGLHQLTHPSAESARLGVSLSSVAGAGLIGLHAGQSILWPDRSGTLCDLHVRRVEHCRGPAPRRRRPAARNRIHG